MSIKRYQKDISKTIKKTTTKTINSGVIKGYYNTLHEKMDKPKRYSMECDDDVHAITVMPNREVHFHNHKNMAEMVHLVTFDMLQNPDYTESKLPTCLKVLRGLRTGMRIVGPNWNKSDVENYSSQLLVINHKIKEPRQVMNGLNNPIPWREEVLNTFKATITDTLSKELGYYGMKGHHSFKMNFEFNMTSSFMPFARMGMKTEDKDGWRNQKVLHLDIIVSPKWLIGVWKKGRAVVNKCLVLDVVKEYPNGTTLCMIARQSNGFSIIPRLAVVDFNRQAISWITEPNKKEEVLNDERIPRMRRTKIKLDACNKEESINELQNTENDIPY